MLEIEADLIEARGSEVQSLVEYRKALLDLELAGGTILQNRNFEPVASPAPSVRPAEK